MPTSRATAPAAAASPEGRVLGFGFWDGGPRVSPVPRRGAFYAAIDGRIRRAVPALPELSFDSKGGMRFAFPPYGQWPPPFGHVFFIIYRLGQRSMRNYPEKYIFPWPPSTLPAGGIGIICPQARFSYRALWFSDYNQASALGQGRQPGSGWWCWLIHPACIFEPIFIDLLHTYKL
jgi:hypothetical protein